MWSWMRRTPPLAAASSTRSGITNVLHVRAKAATVKAMTNKTSLLASSLVALPWLNERHVLTGSGSTCWGAATG